MTQFSLCNDSDEWNGLRLMIKCSEGENETPKNKYNLNWHFAKTLMNDFTACRSRTGSKDISGLIRTSLFLTIYVFDGE